MADAKTITQAQSEDEALKHILANQPEQYKQLTINNSRVWCNIKNNVRIFVPEKLQLKVFELIHAQGHPGFRQTKANIKKNFTWPHLHTKVKSMTAACVACARAKVTRQFKGPLQQFPLPNARFDHIHIDIIGPLPTAPAGYKFALTVIDRYSRMPMAAPMTSQSTKAAIAQLIKHWIAVFGLPRIITADNGGAFTSDEWKQFVQKYNIQMNYITAYHPQSNGMVERMHRQLKESITAADCRDWPGQLSWTLLQMRNAKGQDIPYSPNQMAFGGDTRQPMDLTGDQTPVSRLEFVEAQQDLEIPPPIPGRWHSDNVPFLPKPKDKTPQVYVRKAKKKSLRDAYIGPLEAVEWSDKTVTVQIGNRNKVVTIDRIKPARTFEGKFLFHNDKFDKEYKFLDDL